MPIDHYCLSREYETDLVWRGKLDSTAEGPEFVLRHASAIMAAPFG